MSLTMTFSRRSTLSPPNHRQSIDQSMGDSCLSCREPGAGEHEPSRLSIRRQEEGSGTHPAGGLLPAAATRATENNRPGQPAKRRRDSGRRGAAVAPSSQRAGLRRAAMVQRAQAGMHAPAEDLEEHVTTGSPPSGTDQRPSAGEGGASPKAHTRREPRCLGHRISSLLYDNNFCSLSSTFLFPSLSLPLSESSTTSPPPDFAVGRAPRGRLRPCSRKGLWGAD